MEQQHEFLERVKAEILAEAERLRVSAPLPRVEPAAGDGAVFAAPASDGIERQRLDYAIGELTGADYVAFVEQAFRAVLKRPSDEAGREQQLQLLAHGAAKAEVLGNLRWSPEGRHIGVNVRGLMPRYALAKLGRVRGVGFLVQWALALAGLPLLLRHQRAADTQAAARHGALLARIDERAGGLQGELAQARAQLETALAERDTAHAAAHEHLRSSHDAYVRAVDTLVHSVDATRATTTAQFGAIAAQLDAMQRREDGLSTEIAELRQHVLAMNHWTTSLQRSLDELDQVAQAARDESDALQAALVGNDPARSTALAGIAAAFARHLPAGARVLDLGSGDGAWLRALAACGHAANGVEPNAVLAQRARDGGSEVATGDAFALLGRCSDAGLDGLALDAGLLDDEVALLEFARHAPRALKADAPLLLRFDGAARSRAIAAWHEQRVHALFVANGFNAPGTFGDGDIRGFVAQRVADRG